MESARTERVTTRAGVRIVESVLLDLYVIHKFAKLSNMGHLANPIVQAYIVRMTRVTDKPESVPRDVKTGSMVNTVQKNAYVI